MLELEQSQQKDHFFVICGLFVGLDQAEDPIFIGELIDKLSISLIESADDGVELESAPPVNGLKVLVQRHYPLQHLFVKLLTVSDDLCHLQHYPQGTVKSVLSEFSSLYYVHKLAHLL